MAIITPRPTNTGLFGEQIVADLNPVVQIKFPYNINAQLVDTNTTGSGTVTHADSSCVLSTTANTSSEANFYSHDAIVYQPGQAVYCRFTAVFTTGVAGSTQEIGIGDDEDGFFIGFNGDSFGILHRKNTSDTWVALEDFNGNFHDNSFASSFDATKGNLFQIEYQWLGYGFVEFSIFDPATGTWRLMHRLLYPNTETTPSVYNPSFPLHARAENTTNNTNVVLKCSSIAGFIRGRATHTFVLEGVDHEKTITSEVNILTIRNKSTYQSITNRSVVFPTYLSLACDGTKNTKFRIYRNATLGGTPSYSDVDANVSVVEYDTAGTTVTGGTEIFSEFLAKEGGTTIKMDGDIHVRPGDTLTITAESSASTIAGVGISWKELQ